MKSEAESAVQGPRALGKRKAGSMTTSESQLTEATARPAPATVEAVEDEAEDPWASEDESSDGERSEQWHEDYVNGVDDDGGDSDIDYEEYAERRRAREKDNAAKAAEYYLKLAQKPRDDEQLQSDERHCLYWVHDRNQKREILTGVPRDWRFLLDWLYAVKGRMEFQEADGDVAVPMGLDGPDDAWINVMITSEKRGSREADGDMMLTGWTRDWDILGMKQGRRYKWIRESMILQSLMAQADYAAWLEAWTNVVAWQPSAVVHRHMLPRFAISFPAEWTLLEYEWTPFVRKLFQPKKWSDRFELTYCMAYQTMTGKGFDMDALKPIPVKLRFAPQHCAYLKQLAILKAMMHVITKIKKIEARWRRCPQLKAPPVLYLECLDLDLREWTIYPSVLNAVEKFVATAGVRIANLTLPSHEFDGVYEETQLRSAWAALSCTVVGIQDYRQGSRGARPSTLAGVDRLVVPSFYLDAPYFLPSFMAARDARGVKSVRIEMEEILRSRHQGYDKLFGALIGYAFFSKHSQSSITSLDLDQVVFTKLAMGTMLRVTSSDDPLQQLYQEITGVQGISQRRPISLKKGTTPLRPCWGSSVAKTSSPWTGTVVCDDPNKATMAVYLPGYGLCDIDRSSVPNKKQRRTTSAIDSPTLLSTCPRESTRLRSLSLQFLARNDTTNNDQLNAILDVAHIVLRFADLIGASLESFGFASEDTTDDTLREILNRFKKLQRLRLLNASLDDLSSFAIAYHSGCQIPMVVFKSLMRWLTTDETVKRTLRRLC